MCEKIENMHATIILLRQMFLRIQDSEILPFSTSECIIREFKRYVCGNAKHSSYKHSSYKHSSYKTTSPFTLYCFMA